MSLCLENIILFGCSVKSPFYLSFFQTFLLFTFTCTINSRGLFWNLSIHDLLHGKIPAFRASWPLSCQSYRDGQPLQAVCTLALCFPHSLQTPCACLAPGLAASSQAVWPVPNFASFEEGRGKIKIPEDAQLRCGTLSLAYPVLLSFYFGRQTLFRFHTSAFELVLTLVLVDQNS